MKKMFFPIIRYYNLIKNINNWYLHFYIKFGFKADPVVFKAKNNVVVETPRILIHAFKEIFMEECYMHGMEFAFSARPIIFDIGSNVGLFSLYAASKFPNAKILSYEPITANFKHLEKNKNLNKHCRITAINKAVAGHSGEVTIVYEQDYEYSTTATIIGDKSYNKKEVTVSCLRLQDIFDEHKLDKCDFMKMDCEGAEFDIIYNCPKDYLSRIGQIAMEVHGDRRANEELKKYLTQNGFEVHEKEYALGMMYARNISNNIF